MRRIQCFSVNGLGSKQIVTIRRHVQNNLAFDLFLVCMQKVLESFSAGVCINVYLKILCSWQTLTLVSNAEHIEQNHTI